MATLYLRDKTYWVSYYHDNRKVRFSLKTKDKRVADAKLNEIKVRLYNGQNFLPSNIFWEDFYKDYKTYCETTKAPNTYNRDYKILNQFLTYSKPSKLKDITTKRIRDFLNYKLQQGIAPRTANRFIEVLKAMLNYSVKEGHLPENPAKHISKLKQPQNPPRFLIQDKIEKLLKASQKTKLYLAIVTGLYTGARLGELRSLEWTDFDWDKKILTIRNKDGFQTKNKKFRIIPLHPELIKRLKPFVGKPGKCFNGYVNPYKALKKILNKAELREKGIGFHTLRHTFASHLVMQGVDLATVSKLLGHSDISTTMIYAHLSDEHIKQAIDNLPY